VLVPPGAIFGLTPGGRAVPRLKETWDPDLQRPVSAQVDAFVPFQSNQRVQLKTQTLTAMPARVQTDTALLHQAASAAAGISA
jgi:hypothetical protein